VHTKALPVRGAVKSEAEPFAFTGSATQQEGASGAHRLQQVTRLVAHRCCGRALQRTRPKQRHAQHWHLQQGKAGCIQAHKVLQDGT